MSAWEHISDWVEQSSQHEQVNPFNDRPTSSRAPSEAYYHPPPYPYPRQTSNEAGFRRYSNTSSQTSSPSVGSRGQVPITVVTQHYHFYQPGVQAQQQQSSYPYLSISPTQQPVASPSPSPHFLSPPPQPGFVHSASMVHSSTSDSSQLSNTIRRRSLSDTRLSHPAHSSYSGSHPNSPTHSHDLTRSPSYLPRGPSSMVSSSARSTVVPLGNGGFVIVPPGQEVIIAPR